MNYKLNQTTKEVFHQVLDIRNRFEIQYNKIKPLRFDRKECAEMCPGPKYDKWRKLEEQYSQEALQDFHNNVVKKFSSLISAKRNTQLFKLIYCDMKLINLVSKDEVVNTLKRELGQLIVSSNIVDLDDLQDLKKDINDKLHYIRIILSAFGNDYWFICYCPVPYEKTYDPVHAVDVYTLLDSILNDINSDIFHKDAAPYENHRY